MLAAIPESVRLAHAVRNYFTVISGYAELLMLQIHDPRHREMLGVIRAAAESATETTALHLSPPAPHPIKSVEVGEYVRGLASSLVAIVGSREIRVAIQCGIEAVHVAVGRRDLDQVILNLVSNAADAMGGRGELAVSVTTAEAAHAGAVATFCRIGVSDSGPGVPPETREALFTPFFTTKRTGTGVGLAEVRRIAGAAGGFARVETPENGAEFAVYLPLVAIPTATVSGFADAGSTL